MSAPSGPDNPVVANDLHPVIHAGRVAVITGAASGIGKAAALELAKCVNFAIPSPESYDIYID